MPFAASTPPVRPARALGRFELRALLAKTDRSLLWEVHDPRVAQDLLLLMPRTQPADDAALQRWLQSARKAARLSHPQLAPAIEVGEHERWPYAVYDRAGASTLAERRSREGEAAADVARWMKQALEGLAFAHESGAVHGDLQSHLLLLGENGQVRLMGLEVALEPEGDEPSERTTLPRSLSVDPATLRSQRAGAQRDVLALGLVMHELLATQPALDEPDTGRVIERLPPQGRELVRLPWTLPRPVPEALRAIVNRATDRQERQRYRSARTLARALEGWLDAEAGQETSPHALLLERVRQIGALPAMPGASRRAARLALLERERTIELAELVLQDVALSFDLLRAVNTAEVRGTQVAGNGPVLTVRRAISMVGLDGVRRAANALRPWPGPLNESATRALQTLIDRSKHAGRVAQSLRPAGYDAEVVYLVTLLQNLGRLVAHYHFPEEMAQILRLMQPGEPARAGEPAPPGLSETAAAYAVIGTDLESMGAAVARHWSMDASVLHLIRRLPTSAPVRHVDNDDDMLRAVGSAANEAIEAICLPARLVGPALDRVAQRYVRALDITPRDLLAAVQATQHCGDEVDEEERGMTGAGARGFRNPETAR